MSDSKCCECCGAKIVEYKHSLSKSLLRALAVFAKKGIGFHNASECGMTLSQRCNFPKLQYWGIVEREQDHDHRGGNWRITDEGWRFLNNDLSRPKSVWTYRNKVERYEGEEVYITEVTGGWKYRPEYAAESVPRETPDDPTDAC